MKRSVTVLILILILALAVPVLSGGARAYAEEGDLYTASFSDRDLSASYDAEIFHITLNGASASTDSDRVTVSGGTVTVTGPGTYLLSGTLTDGSIHVDAGAQDKVQLVLDGVTINAASDAAIYVAEADKVFVTLAPGSANTLTNGGSFTGAADEKVDAVIFSKDDLTLNGSGSLTITSPAGHGIVGKDDVVITGGSYAITSSDTAVSAKDSLSVAGGSFQIQSGEDGLHAENDDDNTLGSVYIAGGSFEIRAGDDAIHATTLLQIDGGTLNLTGAEGLEGTCIRVNDGSISISATDDGVNAAHKSTLYTPAVEINGGTLTVTMGPGDTDGIDSNGNLIITGGTVDVTAGSAFDIDGTVTFTGGTVIVNGQQVETIPNQMMGGFGGMMGGKRGGMMQGDPGMMGGDPGMMQGERGAGFGGPDGMQGGMMQGGHGRKSW